VRVGAAACLGIAIGGGLGPQVVGWGYLADLALRLLQSAAPALIFIGLVHGLSHADFRLSVSFRLVGLLALHNLVAVVIGLLVANVLQPGRWLSSPFTSAEITTHTPRSWPAFFQGLPALAQHSLGRQPLLLVLGAGLLLGFTLRFMRRWKRTRDHAAVRFCEALTDTATQGMRWVVNWLPETLPFVVFSSLVGQTAQRGVSALLPLGAFVGTVLLGLTLLGLFYLARVRYHTTVQPGQLLHAGRDSLLTAFVTASSTVAMPVAYLQLQERGRLREEPASLGTLVGANFSKDATVLYLAVAVLFTAQATRLPFGFTSQLQLLLVLASLLPRALTPGAAGAGFPTLALVLTAVGLPPTAIPLLLTVDWGLERCRSALNLLGDLTVSCLLAKDFAVVPGTGEHPKSTVPVTLVSD
jgi:DAACS family dicarboxylate/amino acid:cation (Na+ or H+) symporter